MNKLDETIENIKKTLEKGGMSPAFESVMRRKLKVLEEKETVLK